MERRTLYGYRGRAYPESEVTVVSSPLGGMRVDLAAGQLPPSSSASMTAVLIRDGRIEMRSRVSNIGSLNSQMVGGVFEFARSSNAAAVGWISTCTTHYFYNYGVGNGFSVASFVSANGIGSVGSGQDPTTKNTWQAAPIYSGILDDNVLVLAAHSNDTLLCGYWPTSGNTMVYSYVTGAPRAKAVAAFDNFVLAFNTYEPADGGALLTRVRWSDRGDPFSWTVGNTLAGFEDLLQMRGVGTAIRPMGQRLVLFSDMDVWVGARGSDVFVFNFLEFERGTGCPYPQTIQDTPLGLIYLDRNNQVRLIPKDGGPSLVVSQAIDAEIRQQLSPKELLRSGNSASLSHAVYDANRRVYQLFLHDNLTTANYFVYCLHIESGAWTRNGTGSLSAGAMWYDVGSGGVSGPPADPVYGSSVGVMYSTTTLFNGAGVGGSSTAIIQTPPLLPDDARMKTVTEVRVTYDNPANTASTCTIALSDDYGATASVASYALALPVSSVATTATAYLYGTAHAPVIQFSSIGTGWRLHRIETVMQMSGR